MKQPLIASRWQTGVAKCLHFRGNCPKSGGILKLILRLNFGIRGNYPKSGKILTLTLGQNFGIGGNYPKSGIIVTLILGQNFGIVGKLQKFLVDAIKIQAS